MMRRILIAPLLALSAPAAAQELPSSMTPGPVFPFGPVAEVKSDMPIPEGTEFKMAFDLSDAEQGSKDVQQFARLHTGCFDRAQLDVPIYAAKGFV